MFKMPITSYLKLFYQKIMKAESAMIQCMRLNLDRLCLATILASAKKEPLMFEEKPTMLSLFKLVGQKEDEIRNLVSELFVPIFKSP